MQQQIEKLGKYIESSQKILLVNHIRMDGDALGSLGGLYLILQKLGKDVRAVNDDAIPASFHFLGNTEMIETQFSTPPAHSRSLPPQRRGIEGEPIQKFNPDLIISLDAASTSQLGNSYIENKNIFDSTPFIVIDHHITNEGFGTVNIIDAEYSSTCELVYDILADLGYAQHIDDEIATYLLMGINTDTNIFYNSNTTYNTFKVASELFKLGGNQRQITNKLFKKKGFQQSKLWGEALAISKSHNNGQIVGTSISAALFEKTETTSEHTSGLLNEFLANIDGAKVSYLLYELPDGSIKSSLRSFKAEHNVSQIAHSFGGGGHIQAAGFTSVGKSIEYIEKELLDEIQKYL